jgi:hypothetical protein
MQLRFVSSHRVPSPSVALLQRCTQDQPLVPGPAKHTAQWSQRSIIEIVADLTTTRYDPAASLTTSSYLVSRWTLLMLVKA